MEEITLQDLDYLAEDKLNELGEELFNKLQAEGCNIIDNGWIEELPEKAKKVEEQGEIYYWWGGTYPDHSGANFGIQLTWLAYPITGYKGYLVYKCMETV